MDFSDEPYVRKYTRKTVTSRLLGWEGRAVLDAMLGEFDAAGIFAIRGDAAQCISAVTDLPIEIVRVGLQRLIETETWIVKARVITWPTYEEAQNCCRSDRLRQRASRRARSAQSVTDVTAGHTESQPVTPSHPPSLPPSAPSLPLHPVGEPRAHARGATHVPGPEPEPPSSPTVTEIRPLPPPAGVSRVFTMPCEEPPRAYLDEAVMRAVPLEQARSTWTHYWTEGLPQRGVEKLYPWLLKQAKERANQQARAGPSGRSTPDNLSAQAARVEMLRAKESAEESQRKQSQ